MPELIVEDLTGGLNVNDDPLGFDRKQPMQWRELRDYVPIGDGGAIGQRNGDIQRLDLTAHSTYDPPLIGDPDEVRPLLKIARAGDYLLIFTGSGKVISVHPDTLAVNNLYAPNVQATSRQGFASVVAPASGGQGPVYFRAQNSVGPLDVILRQSSGTGASAAWTATAGTIPKALTYIYAGNRVWAAGIPPNFGVITSASDSRVDFSNLGDPRDWPVANTLQLDPGDGDQITAIAAWGAYVFVFKPHKAWVIYDLDTGANRPLGGGSAGVGAMRQETVVSTPEGLIFIDSVRGPMITDGSTVKPLPSADRLFPDTVDPTGFSDLLIGAIYGNEHVYFVGQGISSVDYSVRHNSWWPLSYPAVDMAVLEDGRIFALYSGPVVRLDQIMVPGRVMGAREDYAYGPSGRTPYFELGTGFHRKRVRDVSVYGRGSTRVVASGDFDDTVTLADVTLPLTGGFPAESSRGRVPTVGVVDTLSLQISSADPAEGPDRLDGIKITFQPRAQ